MNDPDGVTYSSVNRDVKIVLLLLCLSLAGHQANAAEAGARAYNNAPVGLNVLQLLYFQSQSSGGAFRITSHAGVLRYYRYVDLFGQAALIGGFLPYGKAKLSIPAAAIHKQTIGISDPTLVIGTSFFGAPALTHQQFKNYKQDTIIAGSLQITAPLGRYDSVKTLNMGGNRWVIKPELALTQTVEDWLFEFFGHYHYYSSNKEYLGNLTREQKGRWGMDAHISYTIMRGMWLSFDYLRR